MQEEKTEYWMSSGHVTAEVSWPPRIREKHIDRKGAGGVALKRCQAIFGGTLEYIRECTEKIMYKNYGIK